MPTRRGPWRHVVLLVVDLLVLASFLVQATDPNAPRGARIFSTMVVVLALFLSGLTLLRLAGRAEVGTVTSRSGRSVGATFCWALVCVVLSAALKPGWLGGTALLAIFLVGAGVLWNWDSIAAGWREDRARQREQDAG
jgi:protein-S-isoprenylcysteine O-methyltransferase Ste14